MNTKTKITLWHNTQQQSNTQVTENEREYKLKRLSLFSYKEITMQLFWIPPSYSLFSFLHFSLRLFCVSSHRVWSRYLIVALSPDFRGTRYYERTNVCEFVPFKICDIDGKLWNTYCYALLRVFSFSCFFYFYVRGDRLKHEPRILIHRMSTD